MADSSPAEAGDNAIDGTAELRLARKEPLRLRDWFVPFAALLAIIGAVYLLTGRNTTAGGLAFLFGYLSLACTFLPLPTWWLIIWAAGPVAGGGLGLPPLAIATVGAVATAVANMHDYYIVTFLYGYQPVSRRWDTRWYLRLMKAWYMRHQPVRRIRTTRWYGRAAAWYNRAPFGTLAAASFLPIPIDVVRLLAISEGYPRLRFALGSVVGRWPRYFLVAFLADQFKLGWQWAVGIGGAAVVLAAARGLPPLVRKVAGWWKKGPARKEETP